MTIDDSDHKVTRSRVDHATASFYPDSRRIVLVADYADLEGAVSALNELREFFGWVDEPPASERPKAVCTCKEAPNTYCMAHGTPMPSGYRP